VLAITIVLFALGSASVPALLSLGHQTRWLALIVLCGLTIVQGGLVRPTKPPRAFLALVSISAVLVGLSFLSASWSVSPRLTLERAFTLFLLLVTAASLAYAVSVRPAIWPRILYAILGAAVVVCAIGLVVLAFSPDDAVQWPSPGSPARYRGVGQNPNTVPMLAAIALPIAFWLATEGRRNAVRLAGWTAVALLFGTISASNSRGALLAGLAAICVYALVALRSVRAGGATLALVVTLLGVAYVTPKALPTAAAVQAAPPVVPGKSGKGGKHGTTTPAPNYFPGAFFDELGRPHVGPAGEVVRQTFGSSGRLAAWSGALHQADQRRWLGYGFGTEERVFVDRYYTFQGGRPENSYLGLYLQLGVAGVAVLLAAWAVLASAALSVMRARPEQRVSVAAVCAAIVAAGLVLTLVQSYVYSVGNIASVSFWVAAFLIVVAVRPRDRAASSGEQ
jgi:hypothetical protein